MQQLTYIQRPPTIILFFAEATVRNIMRALDEITLPNQVTNLDPVEWYFPSDHTWHVLARFDSGALETYTEEQRELVCAVVGRAPSAILNLTLNSRLLEEARQSAKALVEHLLGMFYGIADDRSNEDSIWNIEEIRNSKRGIRFLDHVAVQSFRLRYLP